MDIGNRKDLSLVEEFQTSGDQKVLKQLFEIHKQKIFRLCMHYLKNATEAEDATVDIYLQLNDKLRKTNISNFSSWLYVVCKNHALKKLAFKSRVLLAEETFLSIGVKSNGSEDHINELLEMLPDAVDQLSVDQRWCIVLFYLHNKSYKEIEQIRGYDFNKVKSSIMHGKKNLLKILEKKRHESI